MNILKRRAGRRALFRFGKSGFQALSKFLEAGAVEGRELGLIAVAVGFQHK